MDRSGWLRHQFQQAVLLASFACRIKLSGDRHHFLPTYSLKIFIVSGSSRSNSPYHRAPVSKRIALPMAIVRGSPSGPYSSVLFTSCFHRITFLISRGLLFAAAWKILDPELRKIKEERRAFEKKCGENCPQ